MAVWLAVICGSRTSEGQTLRRLYDDTLLARLNAIYTPNIRWNLDSLLVPLLRSDERVRLDGVRLVSPVRDAHADPFSYLSFVDAGVPTISLSTFSIKFFDDIGVASAWLESTGHSSETVIDYLGVLKYRRADSFSDGRYPRPFAVLGIPADAARAPVAGDVADKILKSAILFVVAHELGHLYYNHAASDGDIAEAQANEIAADSFAIDLFRRLGIAPLGVTYLFEVAVYLGPNRGDFSNDADWDTYLRTEATHPLSGTRLQQLGRALARSTESFLKYESDKPAARARVGAAARELDSLGRLFDDPELQRWHRLRGATIPLAELRPRQPGSPWVPRP